MVAGNIRGLKLLKIDVGSSVPPESPSMNPETGRFSATYVVNVTKVAENQKGFKTFRIMRLLSSGIILNAKFARKATLASGKIIFFWLVSCRSHLAHRFQMQVSIPPALLSR